MDDTQFRKMEQLIRGLAIQVAELKLQLKRMEDLQAHRHALLYDWCAPASYKAMLDNPSVPVGVPADLKKFFPD